MKILITNDDGISSEGLWLLAGELKDIGSVTVVAPDSEQSSVGTSVSLRFPLQIKEIDPPIAGIETYSVDGTPSDSVLVALGKLVRGRVDLVVSGINHGSNLGEDVYISGTVSAALQGYLSGTSAIAVSAPFSNELSREAASKVAAALVKRMAATPPPMKIFLNVNTPDDEITGLKITELARESHVNTVEEGNEDQLKHYRLVRQRLASGTNGNTDVRAIEQGLVSITPIYFNRVDKPPQSLLESLCHNLLDEI